MQGQFYVVLNDEQRKRAADYAMSYQCDGAYMVQCKPYKPPKTYPQLQKIHAMIRDIASFKGMLEPQVKTDVKREFGVVIVYTSAIDGERKARLKSLADYSREELCATLQKLEVWCAENQIPVEESKRVA